MHVYQVASSACASGSIGVAVRRDLVRSELRTCMTMASSSISVQLCTLDNINIPFDQLSMLQSVIPVEHIQHRSHKEGSSVHALATTKATQTRCLPVYSSAHILPEPVGICKCSRCTTSTSMLRHCGFMLMQADASCGMKMYEEPKYSQHSVLKVASGGASAVNFRVSFAANAEVREMHRIRVLCSHVRVQVRTSVRQTAWLDDMLRAGPWPV